MKPPEVASIHRQICASANCEYLDKIDYTNACVSCPSGHFGRYEIAGCEETIPPHTFEQLKESGDRVYPMPLFQPGDLLSWMIFKITGAIACGSCDDRRRLLNEWGWFKSWRNRSTVIDWLTQEAKARGHDIDKASAKALIKTAFKEAWKQTKSAVHS